MGSQLTSATKSSQDFGMWCLRRAPCMPLDSKSSRDRCIHRVEQPEVNATRHTQRELGSWHGQCYNFESDREKWELPKEIVKCDATARPDYNSMSASEYQDTEDVLQAKAVALVQLLTKSKKCVLFTGAGLSTQAGIADYASQSPDSANGYDAASPPVPPMLAQPTYAHRVLVALWKAGRIYRWVQQNHDGLPQKAGLPQEAMNEIHGSWYAPDNPVIQMSGNLRGDLFDDMVECSKVADLSLAIGTSMCGLNVDRLHSVPAGKAKTGDALGSVVIALQRTVHDDAATLRIFAHCDDIFARVASIMRLDVAPALPAGEYFVPSCLKGKSEDDMIFRDLPYSLAGQRSEGEALNLDLREDAELVIAHGRHAGARGIVVGYDREGNVRCRFKLKPEKGKLRAQMALVLGRWWIQAAVNGSVLQLPVVNFPNDESDAACGGGPRLREFIAEYAK